MNWSLYSSNIAGIIYRIYQPSIHPPCTYFRRRFRCVCLRFRWRKLTEPAYSGMAAESIPTMAPASAAAADAAVVVLFESPTPSASVALVAPLPLSAAMTVVFVSFPPFRYSPPVVSGALVGCGWVDCTEEQSRSGKSAQMCVIRLLRAIFFLLLDWCCK